MNRINPNKLQHSKWTAVQPCNREKHFLVTTVNRDLADRVRNAVQSGLDEGAEQSRLEKLIRKSAGSFVSDRTRRRPMIVPVVLEA